MTNNNPLLGQLLSAHKLGDYRRHGLIGCGVFLLVPLACGIFGLYTSLTDTTKTQERATEDIYVSIGFVAVSVVLFALLCLFFFLAPRWLNRGALEIHENGFVQKRSFGKPQTCLWSEIREVNPMLLIFNGANRTLPPVRFFEAGETETKFRGVYEVYKKDDSKITVSRRYEAIEVLDEVLIPFCRETPVWGKAEDES